MTEDRIFSIIMERSKDNFTLLSETDQKCIKDAMKQAVNEAILEYKVTCIQLYPHHSESLKELAEQLKIK
jgi:hypothetical protein